VRDSQPGTVSNRDRGGGMSWDGGVEITGAIGHVRGGTGVQVPFRGAWRSLVLSAGGRERVEEGILVPGWRRWR
jgi:hypothetical protein